MYLFLKHEGFENDCIHRRQLEDGIQYIFRFENNYGASVVKHCGSYGHEDDLWELAVLSFYGEGLWDWELNYDTDITDDVIGHCDDSEIREILAKIKELEPYE